MIEPLHYEYMNRTNSEESKFIIAGVSSCHY